MDFKESLQVLAARIVKLKDNVKTEEATKPQFSSPCPQQ